MSYPDVTFVLPGLRATGGVRAVFEIADHLRARGWRTGIVVPERTLLAPHRSMMGLVQRYAPRSWAGRLARRSPPGVTEQHWFDLKTPVEVVAGDLVDHLPGSGAVVATSYRTAEVLLDWSDLTQRGLSFVQGYETWSGPEHRVDASIRGFPRHMVTAPWLADLLERRFGLHDVPVAVYGVDLEAFTPRPSGPTTTMPPVVGFCWDDRPVKGGGDLLRALEALRASGARFRARAFGIGTEPLPSWVEFLGMRSGDALVDAYRSFDVFVAAGRQESGPMSVPEAMACGLAVVATDVGDVRTWSDDGAWVKIVAPRDPSALASAVGTLVDRGDERHRLGAGARSAIESFGWDRPTDVVEHALHAAGWKATG